MSAEGVHIGVIDSIGHPPERLADRISIESVNDGYVSLDPEPLSHGADVLHLLSNFAPDASFSTFQIFGEESEQGEIGASRSAAVEAIGDAAGMDIDILNLSIGVPITNGGHQCGGYCALSREARSAVEDGLSVVVAAGNVDDNNDQRYGVHCPAHVSSVVSVAGYVPWCTRDPEESEESGQWWIKSDEKIVGPFCGQERCNKTHRCQEHREEASWRGNVDFYNAAPDVTAPALYFSEVSGEIQAQPGTSFSAPIISGLAASALSSVESSSGIASPRVLQNAISMAATPLDDDSLYKYNHQETVRQLASTSLNQ